MFNFQAFLSYALVVTFTPGPNNIMSMMNGNQYGFKKTVGFMFGVAVGFLTLLLMACFFNLYLYTKLPVFQPIMQVVGAAYMLYLTLKILGLLPSKSKAQPQALNFTTGIALQFLNVKAMLFALTITSSFIIPFFQSPVTLVLFAAFLASLTLLSTSAWTLFGTVFNRFLSKYDKPFKIVMASLLIYSALALLGVLH